jgi:hypothetical protein
MAEKNKREPKGSRLFFLMRGMAPTQWRNATGIACFTRR